jgi:hypothetical protein
MRRAFRREMDLFGAVRGTDGETGKTEEGVTGGHNLRSAAFAALCHILWRGCRARLRRGRGFQPAPPKSARSAIAAGMKPKPANA